MLSKIKQEVSDRPILYALLLGTLSGFGYYVYEQQKQGKGKISQNQPKQTSSAAPQSVQVDVDNDKVKQKLKAQQQELEPIHFDTDTKVQAPGDNKIHKICLTGGPCAGKTSGLSYLSEKLQNQGFSVYIVPEAATLIANGGGMINLGEYTPDQAIQFQTSLMKIQIMLESNFMKIAKLNGKTSVVLCDRGLMDGSAYMPADQWKKMLSQDYFKKNQLNETAIRDRQYDAVIHLVTAADGAEEHYNFSNAVRHEDPIEAIKLDRLLQLAWLGHPRFEIIDNHLQNFEEKLQKLLSTVHRIVGLQGQPKYHRKYLIDTKDRLFPVIPEDIKQQLFFIEDTFITYEKEEEEDKGQYIKCRRRAQGNQYIYIWSMSKMEGGKDKVTLKKMMSYKEYLAVLSKIDEERHPIVKQRTIFMWEGVQYCLDTYINVGEGFTLLKIKLENEQQKAVIPPFLTVTREITDDIGYKTKYLAKKNWYTPSGDETIVNLRKDSLDLFS